MLRNSSQRQTLFARWALGCFLTGFLGLLICFSLRLAAMRIFHADECHNAMMARQAGAQRDLFQLLLLPIVRNAMRSIEILTSTRFLMLEIFWLNIVLIAVGTGERFFSMRGLLALAGAATLAPLWDWGFEIRAENVALGLILIAWCAMQKPLKRFQSFQTASDTQLKLGVNEKRRALLEPAFLLGVLAGLGQLLNSDALWFAAPLAAVMLMAGSGANESRRRLFFAWLGGAFVAVIAAHLLYELLGLPGSYAAPFAELIGSFSVKWGWNGEFRAGSLPAQIPMLIAVAFAAAMAAARGLRLSQITRVWLERFPELLLFAAALSVLVIHPTRLSVMVAVAFGFIAAFRCAVKVCAEAREIRSWLYAAGALMLFAHITPFSLATLRHLNYSNARQDGLMRMAENLTDPASHTVFDDTGMVATRTSVNSHTASLERSLAAHSTPVLIRTVQAEDLGEKERVFVQVNYVPLADDFWVLGRALPKGGGDFELLHAGRYRISSLEGSDLAGTYPEGFKALITPEAEGKIDGTLDASNISAGVVELSAGRHRLECQSNTRPVLVWVGPKLNRIHRLGPGDHRELFVSAY